jgi:hypothetical protein
MLTLCAQSTLCFKKSITDISTIESIKLDGGKCKGQYSLQDMKSQGFHVLDINVKEKNNKLDVVYILQKQIKDIKPKIQNTIALDLKKKYIKITAIKNDTAVVNSPNLIPGQSGIVVHKFKDGKSIILSYATVITSNKENATIKFLDNSIIPQEAIPTSNLKPSTDDIFIVNHLYHASLMIVPNFEAKQKTQKLYAKHSFLNSDIFAGFLKINDTPVPTKEVIQEFAKTNNLGTILFHIEDKLYLVDTLSFKIIQTHYLPVKDKKFFSPFLTNVQDIHTSTFDFTSLDAFEDYDKYYKELLGI